MAKRKSEVVDEFSGLLMQVQWWVGPMIAACVWAIFAYLAPYLAGSPPKGVDGMLRYTLLTTLSKCAGIFTLAILCLWIVAECRKFSRRRKFRSLVKSINVASLTWPQFESMMGEMFRHEGYFVEDTGSRSGDGGVDLRLTRGSEVTLVQCKHWKSYSVGVAVVRELFGVVMSQHAVAGIVLTSGKFSKDAVRFAEENLQIELIDGDALAKRLARLQRSPGPISAATPANHASEKPRVAPPVPLTAQQSSVPPQQGGAVPRCPKCGEPMVLRTSSKGQHAGSQFWGCSKYPNCRGLRQLTDAKNR